MKAEETRTLVSGLSQKYAKIGVGFPKADEDS